MLHGRCSRLMRMLTLGTPRKSATCGCNPRMPSLCNTHVCPGCQLCTRSQCIYWCAGLAFSLLRDPQPAGVTWRKLQRPGTTMENNKTRNSYNQRPSTGSHTSSGNTAGPTEGCGCGPHPQPALGLVAQCAPVGGNGIREAVSVRTPRRP